MELRIFTEPQQGATYDQLVRVAQKAEELGFDAFFRSDHYLAMGGDGLPGPTDAWTTLAGLARETKRIRLGTLVTAGTFRLPGVLAITVAQVDQMSGGRVELGLGTGWYDGEHTAYGIPFPSLGERFDRFEEQLEIIQGLWSAEGSYSFAGEHYQLTDSPALPKPTQSHVPVIVGGFGAKRTPRIAATWADEYNVPFHNVAETGQAFERVREACAETGRSVVLSSAQVVCVGTGDVLERRAAKLGRDVEGLRRDGLAGSPAEVVDKLGQLAEVGATRAYLQVMDLADLDHLELIAAEVLPHV
ncbi:MAG: Coenzyme F420-dependent N10-methylene tetrahydromethanopterin reductase-like protein [Frankiales bacterium]|nr:Coenzyme F420-dependent N10-methylene tetrahydromethanopterin reductase-like protein [Frankiales bacterium]